MVGRGWGWLLLALLRGATASCEWNRLEKEMTCDLRTLDYKRNLTLEHQAELGRANALHLSCSDVFFFESNLRSDHFGSLLELETLNIEYCKIRTLPPRSFVGLSSLRHLSIETFNSEWSAILLDIDYEAFVGLSKLKSIRLSNNNIFRTPAKLFCPLSSIEMVDLRHNRLVDLEDLGLSNRTSAQCPVNLRTLSVSHNSLRALTPGSLASTSLLTSLLASNNQVAVLDRTALQGLSLLQVIDLSSNRLAALPPDLFGDNADLREINLANNSIGTIHLSVFRNLTKLERLDLSRNQLDENWIKEDMFADLSALQSLDLSHNHLSSIDSSLLQKLTKLTFLDLSHNRLEVVTSQALMSLSLLDTLLLSHNQLESLAQLALSASSHQLKILSLDNNKLQSLHHDIFRNLTQLRNLTLSRNLLSELPNSLADLTNLIHFDASINIVGAIGRKDIQGLKKLTFLNLSSNDISKIDTATFNETPSLHFLDLSKNRLQTLDQSSFAALTNLTDLNLADNEVEDINGLLTTQMNLQHLNISSNKLHWFDYAFVPNSLRSLDIHNNQIDSVENYYSLKDGFQLEYLDASRNRIKSLGVLSLLPSLKTILIQENRISDIGHNTFLNKNNLSLVDLRSNQLSVLSIASLTVSKALKNDQSEWGVDVAPTTLSESLRVLTDTSSPAKPTFLMADNPFQCSCQMQWIVNPSNGDRLPHLADLEKAECLVNYHGNSTAVALLTSVPSNQFLCQYDSHCFSLCMCCDFFGCDCRMQCPDGCDCFHDSTWSSNIIQCSARSHAEVPALIPMDATSVFLDGNGLRNLSGQIFLGRSRMKNLYLNNSFVTNISNNTFLGLMDLQLLDLSGNELEKLEGQEFSDLVNLSELYLQANKLLHIAEEVFRPLKSLAILRIDNNLLTTFPIWELATNPFLVGVHIANNAWTCDCEFVSKFRMFIDGNLDKVIDAQSVKCIVNSASEGSMFSGRSCVESSNAAKHSALGSTAGGALYITVACCIIFIAVIFLSFATYKMRDSLKLWAHAKYGLRFPAKTLPPASNSDKLFEAYLSYCLKDDHLVRTVLAPELSGYRLCLHHRDLGPGAGRSSGEAMTAAANASARTVIIMSKAFIASEWDSMRAVLLGPNSQNFAKNVIIVLLEDMMDFDNVQNFEAKTFVKSCPYVLRWQESKFWAKLRYLLPDPTCSSDKVQTTQLDVSDILGFSVKEGPDSGVSSAHISTMSLNNQAAVGARTADSLRTKTKSRQSIPSTVDSNNEFIYLTPKPKKARPPPPPGEDLYPHQRSSSEVYMQSPPGAGNHQRSKSSLAPNSHTMLASGQNLHQTIAPMVTSTPAIQGEVDDPTNHMYGSTSFIYRLISSTGPGESPTLPACAPGAVAQYHQLYHPHTQRGSPQQGPVPHQRSKSTLSPHYPPSHQPSLSHAHLNPLPPLLGSPPAPPPPHRSKLSRSSSQLNSSGQQAAPGLHHRSAATLSGNHRRDSSQPSRPPLPSPAHYSPGSQLPLHQRSKSTPYHGFVV